MSQLAGVEPHPHARAVLEAALPPTGAPSHAYLFCGPSGSGKGRVARAFAAALLAEGVDDPEGAARRVEAGSHPDLTWVAPRSSAGILRGDVEDAVVGAAARTPFEAIRRVFVIERADELNDQAANRMLKTLEEPPPFAHLILLTARPSNVLPTIASRCQHVRFDAPGTERLARDLHGAGVGGDEAAACARLALGDLDRAHELATEEGRALRDGAERLARGAIAGELADQPWNAVLAISRGRGDAAKADVEARVKGDLDFVPQKERRRVEREGEEVAKRAQRRAAEHALDHGLQLVGLWLRDVAAVADGAPEIAHNADRLDALRTDASDADVHRLRAAVATVDQTRSSLVLHPSEELVLEGLAYRLADALRR